MITTPETANLQNGRFFELMGIDPSTHVGTSGSTRKSEVEAVMGRLLSHGVLFDQLENVRNECDITHKRVRLVGAFDNHALDVFRDSGRFMVRDQFNDSFTDQTQAPIQDGELRTRRLLDYIEEGSHLGSPFGGSPPRGFWVRHTNLAVAVLDPSMLNTVKVNKAELFDEAATTLRQHIRGTDKPGGLSEDLTIATKDMLVAGGFTQNMGEAGKPGDWPKPFDQIATLKALVIALGGGAHMVHSGNVRQGAIATGEGNQRIIVGASGQESGLDEHIAYKVAREINDGEPFMLRRLP